MKARRTGSTRRGLKPEGVCWCGCGESTTLGKFWIPGHDAKALRAIIDRDFGDTVDFLDALDYGPGKRSAMTGEWQIDQEEDTSGV